MKRTEVRVTAPQSAAALAARLTITHEMTCESVPVQIEGDVQQGGARLIGYYFRQRMGRWSLSIGDAPELDEKYLVLAQGRIGGELFGALDHDAGVRIIDAVLVAWHGEGCRPMPAATDEPWHLQESR